MQPNASPQDVARLCLLLANTVDDLDGLRDECTLHDAWKRTGLQLQVATDQHAAMTEELEELAASDPQRFSQEQIWVLIRAISATARGEPYLAPSVATRLMSRVRVPDRDAMSAREVEVLSLVSRGASNKEIARQLRLSEATIKSHLLHIFAKLGVSDRTQAVTLAVRKGIIRLEA